MRVLILFLSFLLLFFFPSSLMARTWHVPGEVPTIQGGIDLSGVGDTVLVAPGTYTGDGNRDIDFGGKELRLASESGPAVTVIDCEGSITEPHRGFVFRNGEGAGAEVRGLTIRNGYASSSQIEGGGAILCQGTSPSIIDCVFSRNLAAWGGAAISCEGGSPTVIDCEIHESGSAISVVASNIRFQETLFDDNSSGVGVSEIEGASRVEFISCDFVDNGGLVGVLTVVDSAAILLESCSIITNHGDHCGGMYLSGDATAKFTGCTFEGNTSWGTGTVSISDQAEATFTGCEFRGNQGLAGSAVYCREDARVQFASCTFDSNFARVVHVLYTGGALYGTGNADMTVSDCTFHDNEAGWGGAAAVAGAATFEFSRCTMSGNSAEFGSGLWLEESAIAEFIRSILAFGVWGSAITCAEGSAAQATLLCCDIYDNEGGDWVGCIAGQDTMNNNFSADPLFCDPDNGDFRLSSESPCVTPWLDPACGEFIGACGVGCGTASVSEGRTLPTTWGLVKSIFHLRGE